MTLEETIELSKPIVKNLAKQFCPNDNGAFSAEDLEQIGYLAVVKTHEKYSKITTGLIGYFVRTEIIDYLRAANRYSRVKKENNTVQVDAETYDNLIKYLPDNRRPQYKLDYEKIKELVNNLTDREKAILKFYYFEDWQLLDIGEELDLSTIRIRQIKSESIQKLRKFLRRDICIEGKERLL